MRHCVAAWPGRMYFQISEQRKHGGVALRHITWRSDEIAGEPTAFNLQTPERCCAHLAKKCCFVARFRRWSGGEPPPDYVVYPASYTSFVSGRVSKRRQKNRKWGKDSSRARCSLASIWIVSQPGDEFSTFPLYGHGASHAMRALIYMAYTGRSPCRRHVLLAVGLPPITLRSFEAALNGGEKRCWMFAAQSK